MKNDEITKHTKQYEFDAKLQKLFLLLSPDELDSYNFNLSGEYLYPIDIQSEVHIKTFLNIFGAPSSIEITESFTNVNMVLRYYESGEMTYIFYFIQPVGKPSINGQLFLNLANDGKDYERLTSLKLIFKEKE